jgi:hypothetical protein
MFRFIRSTFKQHSLVVTTILTGTVVIFVAECSGQEAIIVKPSKVDLQSYGNQTGTSESPPGRASVASGNAVVPNGYEYFSDDVLQCNECRRRLGLPTLAVSDNHVNETSGSSPSHKLTERSAVITPGSSAHGSFKNQVKAPQVASQPSIGLSGLPIEARQKLLQGLSLPEGATILSAKFIDPPAKPIEDTAKKSESQSSPLASKLEEPVPQAPQVPKIAVPSSPTLTNQITATPVVTEAKSDPSKPIEPLQSNKESLSDDKSLTLPSRMDAAVGSSTSTIKIMGDSDDAKPDEKQLDQPITEKPKEIQKAQNSATQNVKPDASNAIIASPSENNSLGDLPSASPSDLKVAPPESVDNVAAPPTLENPQDSLTTSAEAKTLSKPTPYEAVAIPTPIAEPTLDTSINEKADPRTVPMLDATKLLAETDPPKSATTIAPDAKAFVVDGVLRSPALQQIQIDFLKKQLVERDDLIRQLNSMPPIFQQQIDELARANDHLRKREQEIASETKQFKIEAQHASQKHEVKMGELKADLLAAQHQLRQQELSFHEKMSDADTVHFTELVKLRKELTEIQNDKAATVTRLRQEIDALNDSQSKQSSQQIADQQVIIKAHLKSIEKLQHQLESANAIQSADVKRMESNRQRQQEERKATLVPTEQVSEASSKESTNDRKKKSNELKEPESKSFELPVPKLKSSKPKVPRIENPKVQNEAIRSF